MFPEMVASKVFAVGRRRVSHAATLRWPQAMRLGVCLSARRCFSLMCCGRSPDGPAAESGAKERRASYRGEKGSWRGRPGLLGGASFWPCLLLWVAGGGLASPWRLSRSGAEGSWQAFKNWHSLAVGNRSRRHGVWGPFRVRGGSWFLPGGSLRHLRATISHSGRFAVLLATSFTTEDKFRGAQEVGPGPGVIGSR